jgi:hypothetical protein
MTQVMENLSRISKVLISDYQSHPRGQKRRRAVPVQGCSSNKTARGLSKP